MPVARVQVGRPCSEPLGGEANMLRPHAYALGPRNELECMRDGDLCMCMCMCMCMCACVCACVRMCMCAYVHVCMCACVNVRRRPSALVSSRSPPTARESP